MPVTGRFIRPLLDAVGAGPGQQLLDLACGPGPVAQLAFERGCSVVATDVSTAMARLARIRLGRGVVAAAEAERLPVRPDAFDGVAINFGLHHFEDPLRALAEIGRTLRPGGRLAYTAWALPEENRALESIDRAFDRIRSPEPPTDFPFGDPEGYRAALGEIGYDADSMELVRVERHWRPCRAEDVFEAELEGGGRKTELLARQPAAVQTQIRAAVVEAVRPFEGAQGIAIPMTAYAISAAWEGTARSGAGV